MSIFVFTLDEEDDGTNVGLIVGIAVGALVVVIVIVAVIVTIKLVSSAKATAVVAPAASGAGTSGAGKAASGTSGLGKSGPGMNGASTSGTATGGTGNAAPKGGGGFSAPGPATVSAPPYSSTLQMPMTVSYPSAATANPGFAPSSQPPSGTMFHDPPPPYGYQAPPQGHLPPLTANPAV